MSEPLSRRSRLWCDAWASAASVSGITNAAEATRWANAALDAYDEKFVTMGIPVQREPRAPEESHQRMRIISDGTGQGTIVYVGDKVVDNIRSLTIKFPSRQDRAVITMEVDADIAVFGVVAPGEVSLLHGGK